MSRKRARALGEDTLLGDGREALPANLLPVPAGETTVRSYGQFVKVHALCFSHHGHLLILGLGLNSVDNENPAENGLGELGLDLARVLFCPQ